MDCYSLTGLSWGQLTRLSIMVLAGLNGTFVKPGAKKPPKVSPFNSLVMVVMLMRRNVTQAATGAIFGCSQSTVSRRWDLLRPVTGKVLASFVPDPVQVIGHGGTALADGSVCPVWDWDAIPDLFSGKAGYAGMKRADRGQPERRCRRNRPGSGTRSTARRLRVRGIRP